MKILLYRGLSALLLFTLVPAAASAQGAGVNRPWNFSLGISGSYEGNALFSGFQDETEEFAHTVQAGLSRSWTLRRGSAALSGTANKPFYRESTGLNDLAYSFAGSLSHALTKRLTWSGSSTFSSGLARDSEVLTDAGLLLPSVTTKSTSSTSSFAYLLTRRSQLTWSVSQVGVNFASALFAGGSSVTSNLSWSRQVGRAQSLGVTQDYSRTFTEGSRSSIFGFLGTWTIAGRRGWTAAASAGVRPYTVPTESGYRMSSTFTGTVSKMVRLGQTLSVSYSKSIEQTFGFDAGNHLVQTLSSNYTLGLGRKVSASFAGSYSRGKEPLTDALFTGDMAQASLAYRILENLNFSAGTSVYGRENPGLARISSFTTYMTLTYGASW
jgi:hypothetical protein